MHKVLKNSLRSITSILFYQPNVSNYKVYSHVMAVRAYR